MPVPEAEVRVPVPEAEVRVSVTEAEVRVPVPEAEVRVSVTEAEIRADAPFASLRPLSPWQQYNYSELRMVRQSGCCISNINEHKGAVLESNATDAHILSAATKTNI